MSLRGEGRKYIRRRTFQKVTKALILLSPLKNKHKERRMNIKLAQHLSNDFGMDFEDAVQVVRKAEDAHRNGKENQDFLRYCELQGMMQIEKCLSDNGKLDEILAELAKLEIEYPYFRDSWTAFKLNHYSRPK